VYVSLCGEARVLAFTFASLDVWVICLLLLGTLEATLVTSSCTSFLLHSS
jgi:hypothetical protein